MLEKINYFDVHSHLHSDFFNEKEDGQKVVEKMTEKNIYSIIIGVDFLDSKKAFEMSQKNKNLFCSIGQHPVDNLTEIFDEKKYQKILDEDKKNSLNGVQKIVCIGECGLDYFWLNKDLEKGKISFENFSEEKKRQKKLFEKQIYFAEKNDLPLMLHVRSFKNSDAHKDVFEILDMKQKEFNENGKNKIRANFHFFTEGSEIVEEIIKRNFSISLPGVITFTDLDVSIKKIPLENLMSETDSPFAAPKPHRGKINTPLFVSEIVKKISEVKNMSEEKCNEQLIKNAIKFFNLKI